MPLAITVTPVPPGSSLFPPLTACNFSPTGSGNTITDSNLTAAHGTPLNSWWSAPFSDGSGLEGHYFQFCFSCGPPAGASHGFATLSVMHNFTGVGGGAAFAGNFIFDSLSCAPFLATTSYDPVTSQNWTATG
jgi:hypothetical protein